MRSTVRISYKCSFLYTLCLREHQFLFVFNVLILDRKFQTYRAIFEAYLINLESIFLNIYAEIFYFVATFQFLTRSIVIKTLHSLQFKSCNYCNILGKKKLNFRLYFKLLKKKVIYKNSAR